MTVKVALLGCGYWGKNVARSLAKVDSLIAIADEDQDRAKEFAVMHGCEALTIAEVMESDDIDAVAIDASSHSL